MTNLDIILKSRDITLPTEVCVVKAMIFPVVIWMWELDYKRSLVLKNWFFWTVVLEKDLASPLDSKKIQPVNPKGYQSWIFIGSTDAKAEAAILWPPDMKDWLIGKDPDAGKDWSGRRRGRQRMRWLDDIMDSMDMIWSKLQELVTGKTGMLQSMGLQRVGHDWATELNWMSTIKTKL